MNRVSTLIIGALFAIAAVEFGLLGASAAGITGSDDGALPPVSERLGVDRTPTATASADRPSDAPVACPPGRTCTGLVPFEIPVSPPTLTATPCVFLDCATPTPYILPTNTPASCNGDPCPTPTWFSPPACDPNEQFCATATPTPHLSPPQLSPPTEPPSPPQIIAAGIDIRANPLTIECNGYDTTTVTVRIFDESGNPVPDGTFVSFSPYNGNADPWYSYTYDGYASTQVSFYGDIFPYGPNLIVESGLLQAGIRIRCTPQSDGCPQTWPESPPPSPGCEPPPPPSPPFPCNPSPGSGPLSPPCEPEPPCALSPPSVSPPCEEPPASPPTAFELQLDCDTGASGIQSYCPAPQSAARDVAVVFTNLSGTNKTLAAFNFTVNNADTATLIPLPGADPTPPQLNDNPDFNEAAINEPGWTCLPVITDLTPGGPSSESLLSCFNGSGSVSIADGESLVLGVVHYATGTTTNGSAFLSIEDGAFYNASFIELGSCNPTIELELNCHGALVEVPNPSPPIETPSPGAALFEMAIDCDTGLPGIQDSCAAQPGDAVEAAVVVTNRSTFDTKIAATGFFLINDNLSALAPVASDGDPPTGRDGNPDFNEAGLTSANWLCAPPTPSPDRTPGGPTSESFIGCYNGYTLTAEPFGAEESIVFATVRYTADANGVSELAISQGNLYDEHFGELGTCANVITVAMLCRNATVTIANGGPIGPPATPTDTPIPTATFTPTPVPPTPTFTHTPTAVPPTSTPTSTPAGNRCADVNGDGTVTSSDIRDIVRRIRGPYIAKYDINRDGKVSGRDVFAGMGQLGRSC